MAEGNLTATLDDMLVYAGDTPIAPTPAERTYTIEPDLRAYLIEADNRTYKA